MSQVSKKASSNPPAKKSAVRSTPTAKKAPAKKAAPKKSSAAQEPTPPPTPAPRPARVGLLQKLKRLFR